MPTGSRPQSGVIPNRVAAGGRPNSIGLGERELTELLDKLEASGTDGAAAKRDFVRWPFRHVSIKIQIFHPGGAVSAITVACRNLSRAGMSILHSAYLHTGTKCRISLPHPTRGEVTVPGWVARCCHRSGTIHEIGIRFDQHLDVQELLSPNPFTDWFSLERVNPEELAGNMVYVEDSELDRKIVKHFLRGTHLNLHLAASAAEAMTKIDDSTDLILVDYHLDQGTGLELAAKLRESGINIPIIVITCDTHAASADKLAESKVNAFLAKPIRQDLLLRAIAEFMIVRKAASAGSTGAGDPSNSSLAENVVASLAQFATRLETSVQGDDATTARTLCLQIAGTAGSVGFADITATATQAAEALSRSMSIAESLPPLKALIGACQRAGGKKNAPAKRPA